MKTKEVISQELKTKMIEFIIKNKNETLTPDISKEGHKIIKDFIDESCMCYEPVSKDISALITKCNNSIIIRNKIEQLLNNYEYDVYAHILYEEIRMILKLRN